MFKYDGSQASYDLLEAQVISVTTKAYPVKKKGLFSRKLSPRASRLATIFQEDATIKGVDLISNLTSILIGEDVAVTMPKVAFKEFLAVVPMANPNSHDYPLGEPTIICGSSVGLRFHSYYSRPDELRTGNSLPHKDNELDPSIRLARPDEIKRFIDRIRKNTSPITLSTLNTFLAGA